MLIRINSYRLTTRSINLYKYYLIILMLIPNLHNPYIKLFKLFTSLILMDYHLKITPLIILQIISFAIFIPIFLIYTIKAHQF